jgi:hypothetical protein
LEFRRIIQNCSRSGWPWDSISFLIKGWDCWELTYWYGSNATRLSLTRATRKVDMNLLRFKRPSGSPKRFSWIILCEPLLIIFSFITPPLNVKRAAHRGDRPPFRLEFSRLFWCYQELTAMTLPPFQSETDFNWC